MMRIGTWNLEGKWGDGHRDLILAQECDVWLLTEVKEDTQLDGYHRHLTSEFMLPGKHWAAVLSRSPLEPVLPDPHPASTAAVISNITFCASVLPWRSCGSDSPWTEGDLGKKTIAAVTRLFQRLPRTNLVWGGDWNQELIGRIYTGSIGGRDHLRKETGERQLAVATEDLPTRRGDRSINHLAVPDTW